MNFSLKQRLFISTIVVLAVFLTLTGLILDNTFTLSQENIAREKLRLQTYFLLSVADYDNNLLQLPNLLSEQRFNTGNGSLIALVSSPNVDDSWRSVSASNKSFSLQQPNNGEWIFGQARDDAGSLYYLSSYSTLWPDAQGRKITFIFTVMEDIQSYQISSENFRLSMGFALFIFGVILLVLQGVIFRWGLKPLRLVTTHIDAMHKGALQSLEGEYPRELQALTINLNRLINNERRQRERYRDRMADLSHSLKTPLSVLRCIETDVDQCGQATSRQSVIATMNKQVNRMSDIVEYQLQRAVSSSKPSSFVATSILTVTDNILAALNKVYADKAVSTVVTIEPDTIFYGDENDLIEILGNVIDNAYKHCTKTIQVSAYYKTMDNNEQSLFIRIEDDGPGVPLDKQLTILKRGVRLDSTAEGQGFGLAIVVDIIESYQGTITIGDADGGAVFTLTIPMI